MEKVKVKLKNKDFKVIEYNGSKIHILTKLSIGVQLALITEYIKALLSEKAKDENGEIDARGYFNRELVQMQYILNFHTNLDIEPEELEGIYNSDLWIKIKESIYNYKDFRINQDAITNEILRKIDKESSLSILAENFVEKFTPLVERVLEMNPEELLEMQNKNKELFEKLEESPLIKDMAR